MVGAIVVNATICVGFLLQLKGSGGYGSGGIGGLEDTPWWITPLMFVGVGIGVGSFFLRKKFRGLQWGEGNGAIAQVAAQRVASIANATVDTSYVCLLQMIAVLPIIIGFAVYPAIRQMGGSLVRTCVWYVFMALVKFQFIAFSSRCCGKLSDAIMITLPLLLLEDFVGNLLIAFYIEPFGPGKVGFPDLRNLRVSCDVSCAANLIQ